jgi:4-oxalocrotonate tautomerase
LNTTAGRHGAAPGLSTTTNQNTMPIVTIQVTREGTQPGIDSVTAEEKAQLIKGVSHLLLDVLKKPLEATFVVIQEVETENWGWGGLPTDVYRKQLALK